MLHTIHCLSQGTLHGPIHQTNPRKCDIFQKNIFNDVFFLQFMNYLQLEKVTYTVILQPSIFSDVFNTYTFWKIQIPNAIWLREDRKIRIAEWISIKLLSSCPCSVYLIFSLLSRVIFVTLRIWLHYRGHAGKTDDRRMCRCCWTISNHNKNAIKHRRDASLHDF